MLSSSSGIARETMPGKGANKTTLRIESAANVFFMPSRCIRKASIPRSDLFFARAFHEKNCSSCRLECGELVRRSAFAVAQAAARPSLKVARRCVRQPCACSMPREVRESSHGCLERELSQALGILPSQDSSAWPRSRIPDCCRGPSARRSIPRHSKNSTTPEDMLPASADFSGGAGN